MKINGIEINSTADVKAKFEATGDTTPAHGKGFRHVAKDMYANIYGREARVFWTRREGFENFPMKPCYYENDVTIKDA